MNNRKLPYLLLTVFLITVTGSFAQEEWIVPENDKGKLSKFEFDEQAKTTGEAIYMINCKSCHGTPGKGDFLTTLVPMPSDPAGESIQSNMDGELYYKIRIGRGPMPSFKNVLTPNQIWNLIAYLRSFNNSYIQEIAQRIEGMELKWEDIEILLSVLGESKGIQAKVVGMEASGTSPVPGADIQLFAKRTFGNILIEESVTNDQGIAQFTSPEDLPGDPEGNLQLLARLTDEETYGSITKDTAMIVGMPLVPVSLVAKRAMWNKLAMAPYWVLITYIAGVLIVWGLIFFVMVELRSIFKIGQYFESKHDKSID